MIDLTLCYISSKRRNITLILFDKRIKTLTALFIILAYGIFIFRDSKFYKDSD